MIEIAEILSAAITHRDNFAVILLLFVTNAVVGFFQERRVKKQLAPNARVLSDGTWQETRPMSSCPAILFISGLAISYRPNAVPGKRKYLLVDEPALTGESLPVEKKTGDTGSIARQGEMDARVTTIRGNTFFGNRRIVFRAIIQLHQITAVKRSSQ